MFIPRDPVNENMFCQHVATNGTGGAGGFIAYAGAVVYIVTATKDATYGSDTETLVSAITSSETEANAAFGFLMQGIKTGYHTIHPAGYIMDKDMGMSHVVAHPTFTAGTRTVNGTKAVPVGVAHLGIWETTYYTGVAATAITPGEEMFAVDGGKISITATGSLNNSIPVAICMKGVTAAQADATYAETTLYPIRIKLLV